MSTLNGQELEIFRAGDYGAKGVYTPADLQQLASDYDPAKDEAPMVIGHPKIDAPAFGWWKSLRADGDILYGTPHQVEPNFDAAVAAGRFKKRSVALARTSDGKLRLRHVGWLGAMPPEVKGLKDAVFSAGEYEEFEFSSSTGDDTMSVEETKKTIREVLAEFFAGFKTAPDLDAKQQLAEMEQRLTQKFADDLKAETDKRIELEQQIATQKAEFSKSESAALIDAAIAQLKQEKRWIAAFDHMGAREVFNALASSTVQEIEFSEGEGDKKKTVKLSPVALFAHFISGLGKIVPEGSLFSESATRKTDAPNLPESAGSVDQSSVTFNEMVTKRAEEKNISYPDAYRQLVAEGKRPEAGSGSAGQV